MPSQEAQLSRPQNLRIDLTSYADHGQPGNGGRGFDCIVRLALEGEYEKRRVNMPAKRLRGHGRIDTTAERDQNARQLNGTAVSVMEKLGPSWIGPRGGVHIILPNISSSFDTQIGKVDVVSISELA